MSSMATVCGSTTQLENIEPSDSFTESMQHRKPTRTTKKSSRGYHNSAATKSNGIHRTYEASDFPKPSKTVSHDSDHDHHTFATSTTASATVSFSENEQDEVYNNGVGAGLSSKDSEMEDIAEEYTTHSFPAGKHTFTLLKHFKHENIVGIVDMMPPNVRYLEDYHDIYMVTDLMETDLHRIIYSKQKLSMDHVQYFAYQLLRGLKYIHSADVIHRDLKPSNLLVNSNCDLKICDFGLARGIHQGRGEEDSGTMLLTEYVVTRWYRAPEIMLACHEYSKPVDVWSVGCIFAELIQRKPYFPGDDYIDQLTRISKKLGKLPDKDLDFVTSDKAKRFMRKLSDEPPVPLSLQFPNTSLDALDVLKKMLEIHPKKRITVGEALAHPFFAQLHSAEDEPVAEAPFDFSFEKEKLHRVRLQELIWQEAGHFRPSCLPVAPRRDASSHSRRDP
eukprot:scaffold6331_cov195-Cylindrotheca_fusiformis.AAC.6